MDEGFLEAVDRAVLFSKNPTTTRPQLYKLPSVETPEGKDGWWFKRDTPFWDRLKELPQLLSGATQGRQHADETTAFVNNVGQGLQFTAVAHKVYQEAVAQGIGHELPTEWFTQNVHP